MLSIDELYSPLENSPTVEKFPAAQRTVRCAPKGLAMYMYERSVCEDTVNQKWLCNSSQFSWAKWDSHGLNVDHWGLCYKDTDKQIGQGRRINFYRLFSWQYKWYFWWLGKTDSECFYISELLHLDDHSLLNFPVDAVLYFRLLLVSEEERFTWEGHFLSVTNSMMHKNDHSKMKTCSGFIYFALMISFL